MSDRGIWPSRDPWVNVLTVLVAADWFTGAMGGVSWKWFPVATLVAFVLCLLALRKGERDQIRR
jgi:Na+-translocating ferredoxin:NAD+ oxidoreductase RnfD subunit